MSDVVNLNRARKRKARAEAEAKAAENRAKFGRTKGERARDKAEGEAVDRILDGSRRDDPPSD